MRPLAHVRAGDGFLCCNIFFVRCNVLPVDICIAVCQHVVQQQLYALRRREVFLPVVVDDRTQRAVDVVVAHALVIQQPCNALAHAALGADVFVVARLAVRPADELAALLGEAHLLL